MGFGQAIKNKTIVTTKEAKQTPNNTSAGGPAPMVTKPYQPKATGVFLTQVSRQPRSITNVKTEPRNIMEWKNIT